MATFFNNGFSRLPGDTLQRRQQEWNVWYSGVPERLENFYNNWIQTNTNEGKFWGTQKANSDNDVVHMPLAGDIASMSANLLFSEPPEFKTEENSPRLDGFCAQNKINQRLLHAAEMCAATGGVYLKIDVDAGEDFPVLTIRYPETTQPTFKANGDLKAVKFSRVIHKEKKSYRLYEKRETDQGNLDITYELWELSQGKDKTQRPVDFLDETQGLEDVRYPGMGSLGAVYVPNSLPNRMFPESDQGISDYGQVITLMDSLDEAWTSWINDITQGRGKTFVDKEILREGKFDPNQKIYTKVDMGAAKMGEGHKPIESVQLAIRAQEHQQTCLSLTAEIVMRCGYSPQSFGLNIEGKAESGTAIRLKERKSILRKGKKARYWIAGLKSLLADMQVMDYKSGLTSRYEPQEVNISLGDSIVHDPREVSETVRNLSQAMAISTYQAVADMRPDWNEERIEAEVERINQEQGAVPVPSDMVGA